MTQESSTTGGGEKRPLGIDDIINPRVLGTSLVLAVILAGIAGWRTQIETSWRLDRLEEQVSEIKSILVRMEKRRGGDP